jgi:uncharacterized protein YggE
MTDSNSKLAGGAAAGGAPRPGRTSLLTMGRAVAVTAAAALLVGIVLGPIIADNHTRGADSTAPEHVISVSGTGVVSVAPDTADISLGVSVARPTAKEARAAAAAAMEGVIASIKKNGVADKDIVTTNVSLSPVYDYTGSTRRLTGYEFGNTVKATVRDLDKVPAVIDEAVAAGATTVYGISFRLDDPTAQGTKARELAMADARAKADVLARTAGVQIKGVAAISEITSSYTPVYYNAAAEADKAGASTPIQSGTTEIRIQVTVAYLIG